MNNSNLLSIIAALVCFSSLACETQIDNRPGPVETPATAESEGPTTPNNEQSPAEDADNETPEADPSDDSTIAQPGTQLDEGDEIENEPAQMDDEADVEETPANTEPEPVDETQLTDEPSTEVECSEACTAEEPCDECPQDRPICSDGNCFEDCFDGSCILSTACGQWTDCQTDESEGVCNSDGQRQRQCISVVCDSEGNCERQERTESEPCQADIVGRFCGQTTNCDACEPIDASDQCGTAGQANCTALISRCNAQHQCVDAETTEPTLTACVLDTDGSLNTECGSCGEAQCHDGQLICTNEHRRNACGGCTVLEQSVGGPCSALQCSQWVCDGTDALTCEVSRPNACGGCEPLDEAPDVNCGVCGTTTCQDANNVACEDPGQNSCGGCQELPGEVGESCGMCGQYECRPRGGMSCRGDLNPNERPMGLPGPIHWRGNIETIEPGDRPVLCIRADEVANRFVAYEIIEEDPIIDDVCVRYVEEAECAHIEHQIRRSANPDVNQADLTGSYLCRPIDIDCDCSGFADGDTEFHVNVYYNGDVVQSPTISCIR